MLSYTHLAQWPLLASPIAIPLLVLLSGVLYMPTSGAATLLGQPYERIVLKLFEPRSHLDQQQQMMKRASNFGLQK
jgi:hypothetical protein